MARQPGGWPRHRPDGSLYAFYTTIDGVQHKLKATTRKKAEDELKQLLRGGIDKEHQPRGLTFAELADKFLERSQQENEPETYQTHRYFLQSFLDHVKHR